ncbi:MAG: hypothetical protein JWP96_783 [Polaromonas sp.]|nr:hypothetical protein [Polaromonas sp.]
MRVLRVFDEFDKAEKAHNALLAAGFEASNVELTVMADEAGGTKGNFVVGNAGAGSAADKNYGADFAEVAFGSIYLLSADAANDDSRHRAIAMMEELGGRARD